MNPTPNARQLFVASCIALIASAFTFVVRGNVMQDMGNAFTMSQENKGTVEAAVFYGMAFSMLIGGPLCDALGMKKIMVMAFLSHVGGTLGTIFAPKIVPAGTDAFYWMFGVSFLMGCGNGLVETAVNPLVATMYSDRKTHMLNVLHAWWPGGLIIGGLAVAYLGGGINVGFGPAFTVGDKTLNGVPGINLAAAIGHGAYWQWALGLILIPTFIYGAIIFGVPFPVTERVSAGVSTGSMFAEVLRPAFILLAFCMLLTASTELGPQKWQESVMTRTANVSGTMVLVYTSLIMFVMRHFAGALAHAISPIGMLLTSSILAGVGLYLLSYATDWKTAFGYATIYGVGIAYFWPTMLGVTAERFPRGGALLMCLIGSVGNVGIAYAQGQMGKIYDVYAVAHVRQADPSLADKVVKTDAETQKQSINEEAVKTLAKDSPQKATVDAAEAEGAKWTFRWVSALPSILVVIFGGWLVVDQMRGGYKAERIHGHGAAPAHV